MYNFIEFLLIFLLLHYCELLLYEGNKNETSEYTDIGSKWILSLYFSQNVSSFVFCYSMHYIAILLQFRCRRCCINNTSMSYLRVNVHLYNNRLEEYCTAIPRFLLRDRLVFEHFQKWLLYAYRSVADRGCLFIDLFKTSQFRSLFSPSTSCH